MQLLGTTHNGVRVLLRGNLRRLRVLGKELRHYAIYRDHTVHGSFHNATDERYLVEHKNDPYWINRGF